MCLKSLVFSNKKNILLFLPEWILHVTCIRMPSKSRDDTRILSSHMNHRVCSFFFFTFTPCILSHPITIISYPNQWSGSFGIGGTWDYVTRQKWGPFFRPKGQCCWLKGQLAWFDWLGHFGWAPRGAWVWNTYTNARGPIVRSSAISHHDCNTCLLSWTPYSSPPHNAPTPKITTIIITLHAKTKKFFNYYTPLYISINQPTTTLYHVPLRLYIFLLFFSNDREIKSDQ